jgi:hypothetical protein
VQTQVDGEVKIEEHIFATDRGIFGLSTGGRKLAQPLPILRLPPRQGRTWDVNFKMDNPESTATYVIHHEQVEVPLGRFDAVALRMEKSVGGARVQAIINWFVEDIGIVKQALFTPGRKTVTYELVQFNKGND